MDNTPSAYARMFAQAIDTKFRTVQRASWQSLAGATIPAEKVEGVSVLPGRKFDRIVITDSEGNARSAHAFVDRATGDLIKAAGWSAPQKDAGGLAIRYNLATPEGLAQAVHAAEYTGGYLYKR